jgi:hypothetical protein
MGEFASTSEGKSGDAEIALLAISKEAYSEDACGNLNPTAAIAGAWKARMAAEGNGLAIFVAAIRIATARP